MVLHGILFLVASPFEDGKVCLRLPGSIGEAENTLSRERGSCVSRVDVESSSVADDTPSPLLSREVLLATGLSVGSAPKCFC